MLHPLVHLFLCQFCLEEEFDRNFFNPQSIPAAMASLLTEKLCWASSERWHLSRVQEQVPVWTLFKAA